MARVLAISSLVVRGHVGLNATVPALQSLGHEVWALPTVLLASRPGLGRPARYEPPEPAFHGMFAALEADGCWSMLDAVITGYFPSPASVHVAAQTIQRIKAAKPSVLVCVDPILGDAGRLYIAQKTAEAIRDRLIPLADVATPNLFELGWLTGVPTDTRVEIVRSACSLGPPIVAVTSATQTAAGVGTLLAVRGSISEHQSHARSGIANGAGDVFVGLFVGRLLKHQPADAALGAGLASLDRVLAASEGQMLVDVSVLCTGPT